MQVLFAVISIAQYFAAVAANSLSLKADVSRHFFVGAIIIQTPEAHDESSIFLHDK